MLIIRRKTSLLVTVDFKRYRYSFRFALMGIFSEYQGDQIKVIDGINSKIFPDLIIRPHYVRAVWDGFKSFWIIIAKFDSKHGI